MIHHRATEDTEKAGIRRISPGRSVGPDFALSRVSIETNLSLSDSVSSVALW
jgi:hypothetical protein